MSRRQATYLTFIHEVTIGLRVLVISLDASAIDSPQCRPYSLQRGYIYGAQSMRKSTLQHLSKSSLKPSTHLCSCLTRPDAAIIQQQQHRRCSSEADAAPFKKKERKRKIKFDPMTLPPSPDTFQGMLMMRMM